MKARHLLIVAAVLSAMVAAWVIAHATTDAVQTDTQVHLIQPFGT
jgi:hypothetical protein